MHPIPSANLCVVGQPWLEHIETQKSSLSPPNDSYEVLFFSEPLEQDYGGPEFWGFSEKTAIEWLGTILNSGISPKPVRLTIRPHPRQNLDELTDWLKEMSWGFDYHISSVGEAIDASRQHHLV